jgi:hypothetical protein
MAREIYRLPLHWQDDINYLYGEGISCCIRQCSNETLALGNLISKEFCRIDTFWGNAYLFVTILQQTSSIQKSQLVTEVISIALSNRIKHSNRSNSCSQTSHPDTGILWQGYHKPPTPPPSAAHQTCLSPFQ